MAKSFDVFLSYNSKDKPIVRELAVKLRARGLKVWLDEWECTPGRLWQEMLEASIKTIRSSAVLVGKAGIGPSQNMEIHGHLRQFVRWNRPVIPVLLPGCPRKPKLPYFIYDFTWVDLTGGLTDEGLDKLQWGITGRRPNQSKSPSGKAPHRPFWIGLLELLGPFIPWKRTVSALEIEPAVKLLLRQLSSKFGQLKPEIENRVHSADVERLLYWGERVVTAESLQDVFSDLPQTRTTKKEPADQLDASELQPAGRPPSPSVAVYRGFPQVPDETPAPRTAPPC